MSHGEDQIITHWTEERYRRNLDRIRRFWRGEGNDRFWFPFGHATEENIAYAEKMGFGL